MAKLLALISLTGLIGLLLLVSSESTVKIMIFPASVPAASSLPSGENTTLVTDAVLGMKARSIRSCPPWMRIPIDDPAAINPPPAEKATSRMRPSPISLICERVAAFSEVIFTKLSDGIAKVGVGRIVGDACGFGGDVTVPCWRYSWLDD